MIHPHKSYVAKMGFELGPLGLQSRGLTTALCARPVVVSNSTLIEALKELDTISAEVSFKNLFCPSPHTPTPS